MISWGECARARLSCCVTTSAFRASRSQCLSFTFYAACFACACWGPIIFAGWTFLVIPMSFVLPLVVLGSFAQLAMAQCDDEFSGREAALSAEQPDQLGARPVVVSIRHSFPQ